MNRCLILLVSILGFVGAVDAQIDLDGSGEIGSVIKQAKALQAEIESLKAQLQVARLELAYEKQACAMPDLMQARLAAMAADQKLKAAVAASTKPTAETAAAAEHSAAPESGSQSKGPRPSAAPESGSQSKGPR